ncbi:MAG: DUF5131 family protein [Acaryochloris sp. RU_4_1]|nr:DUF5131 family protein [Acaryochloris sp. RU_4_1]NJR57152.1 DUF5131 family protein [Acaryochloris sp. CRU_2_0]
MTTIEWTDHTLNPLVGCTKTRAKGAKQSGCEHCYAARASKSGRLQQFPQYHGVVDREGNWTGQVNFVPEQLEKLFRFRKPTRVFMPSMSDPFHPAVKDEWLDQIFAAIALNPKAIVQMLTKRPARMRDYFRTAKNRIRIAAVDMGRSTSNTDQGVLAEIESCQWDWPLPNLWLGVSVENQQAADERIPLLLQTPAAVRFLSCEPLLEAVDISGFLNSRNRSKSIVKSTFWTIIGGESGPGARPFYLEWARSLIQQCRDAEVPVFLKQIGSNPMHYQNSLVDKPGTPPWMLVEYLGYQGRGMRDRKGGDIQEWPEDMRVREFPDFSCEVISIERSEK